MNLIELMKKIPEEVIVEHICPYLYQPQSQELCNDIKSFVYTGPFTNPAISIAPEVLRVPSKEKVSLINDLPLSLSGLGKLGFLFPNIVSISPNYIDDCN